MADDSRYETVLPYVAMGSDDHEAGKGDWRGEVKAKIRVPLDMAVPREILGVVLTPEVSQCVRGQDKFDVSGWLDAMIYYQPYSSDDQTEQKVSNIESEEDFTDPSSIELNDYTIDNYFLDMDQEDRETVMEFEGVERYILSGNEGDKRPGEKHPAKCLTSRIPFGFYFDHLMIVEEPNLSPQVHSVECTIRSSRLIDLEVAIDLLAPERETGLRSEIDEVKLDDDQIYEKSSEVITEAMIPEEVDNLDAQASMESWDEPGDLFMEESGEIESIELIPDFEYPVLGLGYSSHSSPRRPSRSRQLETSAGGGVVRPRSLARTTSSTLAGLTDIPSGNEEMKSKHRNSRRQTSLMRFHFDA